MQRVLPLSETRSHRLLSLNVGRRAEQRANRLFLLLQRWEDILYLRGFYLHDEAATEDVEVTILLPQREVEDDVDRIGSADLCFKGLLSRRAEVSTGDEIWLSPRVR